MMKKNGFTLAELLIVVVILGVLASIAMPKFYPQKEKAVVAEAVAMLSAIRQGELGFKLENGVYKNSFSSDADWNMIGIDNPNTGNTRFQYSVSGTTDSPPDYVYAIAQRTSSDSYNGMTLNLELTTGKWKTVTGQHTHQPKNV